MKKITFKEHYENSQKLRNLLKEEREVTLSYQLKKYCRLPLFLSEHTTDFKTHLSFKPNDKILVKWFISSDGTAEVVNLSVSENVYRTKWKHDKIDRWLDKNTDTIKDF